MVRLGLTKTGDGGERSSHIDSSLIEACYHQPPRDVGNMGFVAEKFAG